MCCQQPAASQQRGSLRQPAASLQPAAPLCQHLAVDHAKAHLSCTCADAQDALRAAATGRDVEVGGAARWVDPTTVEPPVKIDPCFARVQGSRSYGEGYAILEGVASPILQAL